MRKALRREGRSWATDRLTRGQGHVCPKCPEPRPGTCVRRAEIVLEIQGHACPLEWIRNPKSDRLLGLGSRRFGFVSVVFGARRTQVPNTWRNLWAACGSKADVLSLPEPWLCEHRLRLRALPTGRWTVGPALRALPRLRQNADLPHPKKVQRVFGIVSLPTEKVFERPQERCESDLTLVTLLIRSHFLSQRICGTPRWTGENRASRTDFFRRCVHFDAQRTTMEDKPRRKRLCPRTSRP